MKKSILFLVFCYSVLFVKAQDKKIIQLSDKCMSDTTTADPLQTITIDRKSKKDSIQILLPICQCHVFSQHRSHIYLMLKRKHLKVLKSLELKKNGEHKHKRIDKETGFELVGKSYKPVRYEQNHSNNLNYYIELTGLKKGVYYLLGRHCSEVYTEIRIVSVK